MIRSIVGAALLLFASVAPRYAIAEATTQTEFDGSPRYWFSTFDCRYGTKHFTEIWMVEESVSEGGGGYAGGRDLSESGPECNPSVPTKMVSDPLAAVVTITDDNPTLLLAVVSGTLPEKISLDWASSRISPMTS